MRRRSRIYDLFVLPTNTEPPRTRFVVIWGNAFLLGFAVNTAIECFLEGRADYWVQLTVDRFDCGECFPITDVEIKVPPGIT